MDRIVLKWVTALTGILTVAVCITLLLLPKLHEDSVLAAERYQELLSGTVLPEEDTETVSVMVQLEEEMVEPDDDMNAQLRIELPDGVEEQNLEIECDYLKQTIYIRIPSAVKDYFSEYKVKGKCDHIAALSYSIKGEKGIIELKLDKVYELQSGVEDGSLYLDFINPHDIYDKIIVVDAGHGGVDGGATKLNASEKDINLAIVLELKELLDHSTGNIGVYYTRTTDKTLTLDQRVQLANKAEADLFISVHNNASHNGNFSSLHGTEVLYSESQTGEFSSEEFAEICCRNVVEALKSKNKGLVAGDRIYIIRTSEVPVALIEVGYMTNREELKMLQTEEYQKLAAEGIYKAILEAFEKGY